MQNGKPCVSISVDCKKSTLFISTLVAKAFVPNPKNHRIVGHIDGDLTNNKADNLIWGKVDRNTKQKGSCAGNNKPIDEYSPDGTYIRTWGSVTAAANNYDVSAASIRKTCNGKHKSAAQKVWRWKGEPFLKYQVPDVPKLYPGEYFRPIKGTNAEVSNYGRVRNMDKCGILYKLHNDC